MSKQSVNDIWKKQQGKLMRATFKKAVISNVNVSANTADVYFAENPTTTIRNIPLASHIKASLVSQGDKCRVDVFDETNPNDMVVAYLYGKSIPIANVPKIATGTVTYGNGQTYPVVQPHGLGVIPDFYGALQVSDGWYGVTPRAFFWWASGADSTNITITASGNTIGGSVYWFAIKF